MTAPPSSAPTVTDGVVTLRAHRPDDVDEVLAQGQDLTTQEWTTVPVPYSRANAETFVLDMMPQGWSNPLGPKGFAIEALDGGRPRFAGSIDFRPDGQGGAEVGFGLAPWARGQGVMTRALRLGLGWAFTDLELEVVHWRAHVGNWASRRVAWACGFQFHGTVRSFLAARGQRYDGWVASLLRDEPMAPGRPWLTAPVLVGRSVVLRPWRDADVPRIVEQCNDPVAQRFLPHLPTPYGASDARAWLLSERTRLAEGQSVGWCIADPGDDRAMGSIDVFGLERTGNEAEVGYLLHPEGRGRGLMREAIRLAVRHAVVPVEDGGLGLARLALRAAVANVPSRRAAESVGFREIGVQRCIDPQPDGSVDDLMSYDLLAGEVVTR
jgi:RimJ/RimL family protein N-acetyltransferase